MSTVNLDKLDLDGLHELQKDIQARIQAKQREYRNEIKAQIRDLMTKADLTPSDLEARARTGTGSVAIKYRSKDGTSTWTGRGRKPKWVAEHLANGGSMDDLAV